MSEFIGFFVHHPVRILALGTPFLLLFLLGRLRRRPNARINALLVPLAFCVIFAVWEWVVMTQSPEANIRIDLLLIWPVLLVLTVWSLIRAFRK